MLLLEAETKFGWRFQIYFLNESASISIKFSMEFVPKGPIDNNSALVQIMAWRQTGDKPPFEPMVVCFTNTYMRHPMRNELRQITLRSRRNDRHFANIFHCTFCLNMPVFDWNFTEMCSCGFSDNTLAMIQWQAIIWTNDDQINVYEYKSKVIHRSHVHLIL